MFGTKTKFGTQILFGTQIFFGTQVLISTKNQPQLNPNQTPIQPIVKLECGTANPACIHYSLWELMKNSEQCITQENTELMNAISHHISMKIFANDNEYTKLICL